MLSQFNVTKTLGESTWVYNTLTSAFVKMPTSVWNDVEAGANTDISDALRQQGIIVGSHETEINKYRYIYYSRMFCHDKLSITIAPTMQCNFGCNYCFEGTHKTMPKMKGNVIEALVNYITKQSERKEIAINWFGGEPLMAFDVIEDICDRLNANHVNFRSSMVTNGSLLTDSVIASLDKLHLNYIQITLDGTAADHDRRRCYKNGRPSFNDIISNISHLLAHTGMSIVIQVGVDNTNPNAYEDVHKFFSENFGIQMQENRIKISCNNIQNRTGFDNNGTCMTDRQLLDRTIKATDEGQYPELMVKLPGKSLPCMYRCSNQPAIDPEGYIYRCLEHLGQPTLSIGNVTTGKVTFSKVADMAFRGDPFSDPECLHCPVLPICGGGCPNDIARCSDSRHKDYCSPHLHSLADTLPALYKKMKKR